jgi:hypothetical protein
VTDDEFKQLFDTLRRHFDVTAERMEKRFDLLAEIVHDTREELQRTRTSLEEKIERSAAETQAMIKFFPQGARSQNYSARGRAANAGRDSF